MLIAHGGEGERRRYRAVLEAAGHEVTDADDVDAALAEDPDVALVPAGSGLLERIKAHPSAFGCAVLVVEPASPDVAGTLAALEHGAQDVLVAPVADGELVARVSAAGRTKSLQGELVAQHARLEALLHEDVLTGLANRRFILAQLAGMMSGAQRHGRPLAVAIVDVDHFKAVNDTHGHAEGDRVLTAVAAALRRSVRAEDQIGRLGGEEFLVLLPDTSAEAAAVATEHLRTAAAATGVTVSIGWAAWQGEEAEGLLARADDALYAAKAAGRDRVVGAPATLPRRR